MNQEIGKKINKGLTILVQMIYGISIIIWIFQQQYYPLKLTMVALIATGYAWLLKKIFKVELPVGIQIGITLFIFGAQYLGSALDVYGKFFWWDTALHTLSGVLFFIIGVFVIQQINAKTNQNKLNRWIILLFAIGFSLTVGVAWEIIEYTADTFFGANMQRTLNEIGHDAIKDTMKDLIVATIGTCVTAIVYQIKENAKGKELQKSFDK